MKEDYVNPQFNKDGYNCPHCGAFAHQKWHNIHLSRDMNLGSPIMTLPINFDASSCEKCQSISFWFEKKLIYPLSSSVPLPSSDMPDDVKSLYNEARNVMIYSPRASAALLRLAIEQLMPHLKAEGADLNSKIGFLVRNGLNKKIQEALDSIRVIGNHAVHPGQISIDDNPTIAIALFNLLNIIVESTITSDKQIKEVHDLLPIGAKAAIDKRDSKH
jgi:hypothetical protein